MTSFPGVPTVLRPLTDKIVGAAPRHCLAARASTAEAFAAIPLTRTAAIDAELRMTTPSAPNSWERGALVGGDFGMTRVFDGLMATSLPLFYRPPRLYRQAHHKA